MKMIRMYLAAVTISVVVVAEVEFVAFGDWGEAKTEGLSQTMEMVDKTCPNRDFTILLGDNFYPGGVATSSDPKFKLLFEDIVTGKNGKGKPHYTILGNHDYMQNVDAQIEYSALNPDWVMPAKYYSKIFEKDDVVLCLIFTDTVEMTDDQIKWIDDELTNQPLCADPESWRIVSGHYPIYSAGAYGDDDLMKKSLLPILTKHKVHLHLSGHEHLQQVFSDGKITTLVSGAVGRTRAKLGRWRKHDHFVWGFSGEESTGFMQFIVNEKQIKINFVSSLTKNSGNHLAEFFVNKSSPGVIETAPNHIVPDLAASNPSTNSPSDNGEVLPTLLFFVVSIPLLLGF